MSLDLNAGSIAASDLSQCKNPGLAVSKEVRGQFRRRKHHPLDLVSSESERGKRLPNHTSRSFDVH